MCLHLIRRWKYQEFDHGLSQLSPIYSLIFFFFWRIILLTSGHNSHFLKYLRFQPNWFLKLDTPKTRYRLQLVMLTTFQSMDHCTPISKSIQLNYIYVVIEINNEIRCKDRLEAHGFWKFDIVCQNQTAFDFDSRDRTWYFLVEIIIKST